VHEICISLQQRKDELRIIHWRKCILLITAGTALICLLMGPSTATATDKTQDELTDIIVQIAKDEYHKHSHKWTGYEKQFTLNMSVDKFAAFCIGIARFEHRRGRKWKIDRQAKIPIYNPAGSLDSYDYGVMQINSKTGKMYFHGLDYEDNISDNIRAGVKHLAAGFNEAYSKGFRGRDAINYGLQFYNPSERERVDEIWHFIPKDKPPPAPNISSKAPIGVRPARQPVSRPGNHDGRIFNMK
jgi:hypothetical protein